MGYPKENGHPFLALRFSAGALVLFSFFAAANLVGCSDSSDSSPDAQSPPPLGVEVAIESGLIRGHDHPESLVWEWLGVPFAKPPIGDLRWRAPQQMDAWEGVRETTNFGNACPQPEGASVIGDEDCLHLNLWRPRSDERDLPVYVWVHGGGNKLQSNSVSRLQGDRLAEQANVVVVSSSSAPT